MSSSLPASRAHRKAETRDRVLRAALELFVRDGFEKTSTAAIARHAGVAQGTVFTIAPTKDRLALMACQDQLRETGAAALSAGRGIQGLAGQFTAIFEALYDFYAGHPELSGVLLKEQIFASAPDSGELQEQLMEDFFTGFGMLAAEAQARGELDRQVNIQDLITGVFGIYLLFLLALLNGRYPDRNDHRTAYQGALNTLLHNNLSQGPG